jgi:hypothetical protein
MVLYRSESGDDPHDEVEPVIPNGESLDFDDRVRYLDHVNVYPVFQSFAIGPFFRVCGGAAACEPIRGCGGPIR